MNKCSCSAPPALGVTKFKTAIDIILVTLCCATYVRLRCSTNPPQFVFCQFKRRTFWADACQSSRRQHIGESEAGSLNKGSCLAPPALGVTKFKTARYMILVTLCCATYVQLRCSTNPPLPISKGNIFGRCLPEQPKAASGKIGGWFIEQMLMLSSSSFRCDKI